MTGKQKRQLTMFYLFANADGKCSREEEKRLGSIAESFEAAQEDIQEIEEEVSRVCKGGSDIPAKIIVALDRYENDSSRSFYKTHSRYTMFSEWFMFYDSDKLFSIWTMISLGYADTEYSENEKRIVKHLVEKWEIDSAIVSVMIDTAETMLALEAKKTWAKSSSMSYDEVNKIIADADADIKRLYHTVEVTISEADIK